MSENLSPKKVKAKTVKVSAKPKNSNVASKQVEDRNYSNNEKITSNQTPVVEEVDDKRIIEPKDSFYKKHKRIIILAIAAVLALLLLSLAFGDSDDGAPTQGNEGVIESSSTSAVQQAESAAVSVSNVTNANSVWLNGYTDINDFEYYTDGTEIYIQKYRGNAEKVRVASTYEINGVTCNVVSFDDATFIFSRVSSVIIPNGTRYLANNTFNSSSVKFIYLPNSLTGIDKTFWGYFHDVQKIYYGGSQDEWNSLYNGGSAGLDAQQIIFGQNPDELK